MNLDAAAWPEVDGGVLAVPLGSTEQHGPHLPIGTDTAIAVALCSRLASARTDVVVAPAIPYGSSGEHQEFPGTISIGQQALEIVLVELGRSAASWTPAIVFVNGHGGNLGPLHRAVGTLTSEGRDVLAWSPSYDGDLHAGSSETSLCLALGLPVGAPVAGASGSLADLMPALTGGRLRQVSPTGVLGDARTASASEGQALLEKLANDLGAAVHRRWPR